MRRRAPISAGAKRTALLKIDEVQMPDRFKTVLVLASCVVGSLAFAQERGPEDDWRPMVYSDVGQLHPEPDAAPYAELWQKNILNNDESYMVGGDMRYQNRHAPATDAHFVVRSPIKTAVLSILDTGTGCTIKETDAATGNVVKKCPMITAIYTGSNVAVTRGRTACFLELATRNDPGDPANSVAYASYDVGSKSIRVGVIMNHRPVEGCGQIVPVYDPITYPEPAQ